MNTKPVLREVMGGEKDINLQHTIKLQLLQVL